MKKRFIKICSELDGSCVTSSTSAYDQGGFQFIGSSSSGMEALWKYCFQHVLQRLKEWFDKCDSPIGEHFSALLFTE